MESKNNEKVQYIGVIDATVKYDNQNNADTDFIMAADFKVKNKEITEVLNGSIVRRADNMNVGSFSIWGGQSISFNLNSITDAEAQKTSFSEAIDFVTAVRAQIIIEQQ